MSGKKETIMRMLGWPFSIRKSWVQCFDILDIHETRYGVLSETFFMIMLVSRVNVRPMEFICSSATSMSG